MRKAAVVELEFRDLSRLMNLPEGQRVVRAEYSLRSDNLQVLIEGEGLPELAMGVPAHTLRAIVREVVRAEIDWSAGHG